VVLRPQPQVVGRVELTVRLTVPGVNADASRIAEYLVFGSVGGAKDPIDGPIAGRLVQFRTVSVQLFGAVETT
jgi:hypothetical protein